MPVRLVSPSKSPSLVNANPKQRHPRPDQCPRGLETVDGGVEALPHDRDQENETPGLVLPQHTRGYRRDLGLEVTRVGKRRRVEGVGSPVVLVGVPPVPPGGRLPGILAPHCRRRPLCRQQLLHLLTGKRIDKNNSLKQAHAREQNYGQDRKLVQTEDQC